MITLDGEKIKEVTAFVVRVADTRMAILSGPSTRPIRDRVQSVFQRFGFPDHLD